MLGVLFDHPLPDAGHGDEGGHVDEVQHREDGEDDEPEPHEDEDLLVDDVGGKHAQGVVLLEGARVTVLVEGALSQPAIS